VMPHQAALRPLELRGQLPRAFAKDLNHRHSSA
jgi:hypothetical protein